MKTIMALGFAAVVAMVPVTAQAQDLGQEFCSDLAAFAAVVAQDRDKGIQKDTIKLNVFEAFSGTEADWMIESMLATIDKTYTRPYLEPRTEGNFIYETCMGE